MSNCRKIKPPHVKPTRQHRASMFIRPHEGAPAYVTRCNVCGASQSFTTTAEAAQWCDEHDGRKAERDAWFAEQMRAMKRKARAGSN